MLPVHVCTHVLHGVCDGLQIRAQRKSAAVEASREVGSIGKKRCVFCVVELSTQQL